MRRIEETKHTETGHVLLFDNGGRICRQELIKRYLAFSIKKEQSLLIADPNGMLFRTYASILERHGFSVKTLNFLNSAVSDTTNLLSIISGAFGGENALALAKTIAWNISPDDMIYRTALEELLNALLLKIMYAENIDSTKRNLNTIYQLVTWEDPVRLVDTVIKKPPESIQEISAQKHYQIFLDMLSSGLAAQNVYTALTAGLAPLQDAKIGRMLSFDGIKAKSFADEPLACFVKYPDVSRTYHPLTAAVFFALMKALEEMADENAGELPRTVNVVFQDFPTIGVIPDFHEMMLNTEGKGLNMVLIMQSREQLKFAYPDSWYKIEENCGIIAETQEKL